MTISLQKRAVYWVVAVGLMVGVALPMTTTAASNVVVTDATIAAQTTVVQEKLISTMTEYVTLLQLVLIQKLEARVKVLQAQQK